MSCDKNSIEFQPIPNTLRFVDRTHFRYGHLIVLGYLGNKSKKKSYWWCRCECGAECEASANNLVSGNTTSCGCASSRHAITTLNLTHGLSGTAEHRVWTNMRNRCNNPANRSFANYGGRGITVCERWDSFENFLADMGKRPTPSHSIERLNNHRGYSPDNCKWSCRAEQARNKRTTVRITFQGKTKSAIQWCEELHKNPKLVESRLRKGWSARDALTLPLRVNQFG